MKVLLILNHVPDYRESFLRKMGAKIDLTVVAQPCAQDGLTPPATRTNYRYLEIPSHRVMGLQWQDGLHKKIDFDQYDIICCNLNPRQPQWIIQFLKNRRLRKKWIWWGPIQGKSQSVWIQSLKNHVISQAAACLVYSEPIASQLREKYQVNAMSFNNTEVEDEEFRAGAFGSHHEIRLLFVGKELNPHFLTGPMWWLIPDMPACRS